MLRARSEEAKDQRRESLLQAALDEFFERGFAAARMADIAKRAGVSKGALYLYFDSKEAMFKALVGSFVTPNIEKIEQIAEQSPSLETALQGLAAFAPAMIRESDVPRLMKVLIGDSHMFPEIIQAYREELMESVLALLAGVLESAEASGEIRVSNPYLTARLIVAPIVLSAIWQALFGGRPEARVDLDELFRIHAEMILRALKTGTTS